MMAWVFRDSLLCRFVVEGEGRGIVMTEPLRLRFYRTKLVDFLASFSGSP